MPEKKWKNSLFRDRALTTTGAALSVGVLGGVAALTFSPIALAVAGVFAAGRLAVSHTMLVPFLWKKYVARKVRKGDFIPVPESERISLLAAELSAQMGRKQPPVLYTLSRKGFSNMMLPGGSRWMARLPNVLDEMMSKLFAALPGTNTIVTTEQALGQGLPEQELRFIVAHELSHLKTRDHLSPAMTAKSIVGAGYQALAICAGIALVAGLFGLALPVFGAAGALVGIGALFVAGAAAKLVNNIGLRALENRADRNGLHATGSLLDAASALAHLNPKGARQVPWFQEITMDHPSFLRRAQIMTNAFNRHVSKSGPGASLTATLPDGTQRVFSTPMRRADWKKELKRIKNDNKKIDGPAKNTLNK